MKEFWNERYAVEDYVYGKIPNAFFKEFVDRTTPGSVLLVSEGEGRNSVYAAGSGWKVYAVDFSDVAREKALRWAKENRVSIQYDVADILEWDADIQVDCVALIYAHFPVNIREMIHEKIMRKLKTGGTLVLEAFSKRQLNYNSGGPRSLDLLYDVELMAKDFAALDRQLLQEKIIDLDEGDFHRGKASVVQMIAKKNKI